MAALFSDDPDSAITYLEEATKLEPNRNDLFFHLGMAHFAVREVETSRQILQRVHENEPDVALYAGMLGRVLVNMRRFEEALTPLERSAAIDPKDPDVFMAIGYSRERLGQKTEAAAAYARSCSLGLREACSPGQAPPGK